MSKAPVQRNWMEAMGLGNLGAASTGIFSFLNSHELDIGHVLFLLL